MYWDVVIRMTNHHMHHTQGEGIIQGISTQRVEIWELS